MVKPTQGEQAVLTVFGVASSVQAWQLSTMPIPIGAGIKPDLYSDLILNKVVDFKLLLKLTGGFNDVVNNIIFDESGDE